MNISTPCAPKIRSTLFGREDLLEVYRQAKDYIVRFNLRRMYLFSEENGLKRLTICNLWRIEREADGTLRTLEFDLHHEKWVETVDLQRWPDVPFCPIVKTQSLEWGLWLCKDVLYKALRAAGFSNVPEKGKNGVSSTRVCAVLLSKYLGGDVRSRGDVRNRQKGKSRKVQGLLSPSSIDAGARALRAAWWDHFVDRDIISALLVVDWQKKWTVAQYLEYAQHRPALLKVAAEHRNLLPILQNISPSQWGRDDLFSRKLWVRDGRKSTALDRSPVRPKHVFSFFASFEIATPWNWLSKASSLIVQRWVAISSNHSRP